MFSQVGGKTLNQVQGGQLASLISTGNIATLVLATPDKPLTAAMTTNAITVSTGVFPLGTKFMTFHCLLSVSNTKAAASLPTVVPQVQVTVASTVAKTFLYPFTNTTTSGTTLWCSNYICIPIDRTNATCQYTVSLIPLSGTGSSTVSLVGGYVNFIC